MIPTLLAAAVLGAPRVDPSDWPHLDHFDSFSGRNA